MDLIFKQLNPRNCLTYLVGRKETREVMIVDPVIDHVEDYQKYLKNEGLRLTHVVDTHTHADHISGAASLMDKTSCEYVMYTVAQAQCPSVRVSDGLTCTLAGIEVEILYTPGHTMDSMCLVLPDRILTGDTLFLGDGGAGRDDLPGGNAALHFESLQKLLTLPGELIVYPAHEYRGHAHSSLDVQREKNPYLSFRSKDEFVKYIERLRLDPADWMKDVLKANYACTRDPEATFIPKDSAACETMGTTAEDKGEPRPRTITVGEVRERLESDNPPLLLDVRETHELSGKLGHIPGITHVQVGMLAFRLAKLNLDSERDIVTICRSGGRATTAAKTLMKNNFNHVFVMTGGMTEWKKKGFPVEGK